MKAEFIIKAMGPQEVDFAIEAAAREGWNPGRHDGHCFYQTDPGGFLIGCLGSRPVGCISAVSHENVFGFIGFYIVLPEYRGQGYGIRLWQAAIKRLGSHLVGLDGVPKQQDNYRKSGFSLAYDNIRYEGTARKNIFPDEADLIPIGEIPFEHLEKYDSQCFPAPRRAFLKNWLTRPESFGVGFIKNGRLGGYGLIRKCRQGYKIGPLFADDPDQAETIFLKLCSFAEEGEKVYLDIPERNQAALILAERYGLKEVFGTARMYNREEPKIALDKIFGVTTFELG